MERIRGPLQFSLRRRPIRNCSSLKSRPSFEKFLCGVSFGLQCAVRPRVGGVLLCEILDSVQTIWVSNVRLVFSVPTFPAPVYTS